MELLFYCAKDGSIPADLGGLGALAGVSPEVMDVVWPVIKPKFEPHKKVENRLTNSVIDAHRKIWKRKQKQAALAGVESGKKRIRPKVNESSKFCANDRSTEFNDRCNPLNHERGKRKEEIGNRKEEEAQNADGATRSQIRTITQTFPVDVWADRLYSRHVKRRDRELVNGEVWRIVERCQERGVDPEDKLAEIEACLIAWNTTPDWQEKNGRFAPKLAEWLRDEAFGQWPTTLTEVSPAKSERELAWERA